jgi:RNA polymerase primary sigma factor
MKIPLDTSWERIDSYMDSRNMSDFSDSYVGNLVNMFIGEASQLPLLTFEEEVILAKRIELGLQAREELARGALYSKQSEKLRRFIDEGFAAHEKLVLSNTRLVISIAKRHWGYGVPLLDLIQEGNIGLIRAIKKFDYRRGYRFSTYASWWIRQAIARANADQGYTVRIPAYMYDQIVKVRQVTQKLSQKLGREPTDDELARKLGLSLEKMRFIRSIIPQSLSLEHSLFGDDNETLVDFLSDNCSMMPEETAAKALRRRNLEKMIGELPKREAVVIQLRFGFRDGRDHTLKEIGDVIGVSKERVRQIEAKALHRLRNTINS